MFSSLKFSASTLYVLINKYVLHIYFLSDICARYKVAGQNGNELCGNLVEGGNAMPAQEGNKEQGN